MSTPTTTPVPCPNCLGQNTAKTVESQWTAIHICRDCRRTFVIEKPSLRKEGSDFGA